MVICITIEERVSHLEARVEALERKTFVESGNAAEDKREGKKAKIVFTHDDVVPLEKQLLRLGEISGRRFALEVIDFLSRKGVDSVIHNEFEKIYALLLKEKIKVPYIRDIRQLLRDTKNQSLWLDQNEEGAFTVSVLGYKELAKLANNPKGGKNE